MVKGFGGFLDPTSSKQQEVPPRGTHRPKNPEHASGTPSPLLVPNEKELFTKIHRKQERWANVKKALH